MNEGAQVTRAVSSLPVPSGLIGYPATALARHADPTPILSTYTRKSRAGPIQAVWRRIGLLNMHS